MSSQTAETRGNYNGINNMCNNKHCILIFEYTFLLEYVNTYVCIYIMMHIKNKV